VAFIEETKTSPDLCYINKNERKNLNYPGRKEETNYANPIPALSYIDLKKAKWKHNASRTNRVTPNLQPHVYQNLVANIGVVRDQRYEEYIQENIHPTC